MAKSILFLTLIYFIHVSGQRYAPSAALREDLQRQHPCTRRKVVPYNIPAEQAPSFINRGAIPNNNINAGNVVIEPALIPITNDDKAKKIESAPQLYPGHLHGEFFRNNEEILLFPQTETKQEDNANANTPKPLLVSNEGFVKEPASKQDVTNANDEFVLIDNDTLVTKKSNPHAYEHMLLQKIAKEKPKSQEAFNENVEEIDDMVPNNCVSKSLVNENFLETRRSLSDKDDMEENVLDSENSERRFGNENNGNRIRDPARGAAVSELSPAPVNLLTHSRVCYACSSVSNPTCWHPDRRTTVKYCRIGHEACVTKTFKTDSSDKWILTRDCGKSCEDTDIPGPKYKSCSVCHSNMCNDSSGATPSIKADNIIITIFIVFIAKNAL